MTTPIRRALLSVSDKNGLLEFARALHQRGIAILSTGGTATLLQDNAIPVTQVSSHTGFPEIMAGRVKTLHPKIHGGLLGRLGLDEQAMREHGIAPIDLLVVNLYPFAATIARPGCSLAEAIENIDIGGPAMVRAAAKNHERVTVIVDPGDYDGVLRELAQHDGEVSAACRARLAAKAFAHTAGYDSAVAAYLQRATAGNAGNARQGGEFPATLTLRFDKRLELRYGENPHQAAAFYATAEDPSQDPKPAANQPAAQDGALAASQADGLVGGAGIGSARQLQGKALSYNNIADADTALECVRQFHEPACVIVKHANPCGVALGGNILEAYDKAYRTDPTSAFGGIIAFNRHLDAATASAILERQFIEVIIVPGIDADAVKLCTRKENIRVLLTGELCAAPPRHEYRSVNGGLLVQTHDAGMVGPQELRIVTRRQPSARELEDLLFAWQVCKFVKSNAIVYAKERMTIGVGAGQMSRVVSSRIAAMKAQDEGLDIAGAVMASDAFFPFRDGLDVAAEFGIQAVIQPGGSKRDEEVIAAADAHGMAMALTGMRHFRH